MSKTPSSTPKPALAKDKLPAIIKRLAAGERALIEESKALGFSDNGALRAALRAHLGSKAKYRALIEKGMAARMAKAASPAKPARRPAQAA
jgi:methylphosphotriester-DNA--protein-cysteine methyltransferase